MTKEKTELLIHPHSARKWSVICRPDKEGRLDLMDIKNIYTARSKELCVAFAEGRQSVTGEPIRMS